jgi:hypothetical protein
MRLPSCRSAWPSIHPPIASRSWLEVSFIAIRIGLRQHVLVHHGRALRDQPRDETTYAAAPDDFLDMPEETLPPFDRPLRRPQIGLVEDEVQRLLVRLVERFGKSRHEPSARRVAAELGEIDDTGERLACDYAAECGARLGDDRHVGMLPAEHHDGIAGGAAVGARPQPPPHAERIDDRHPSADIEQPLDKALRGIGFARAGGTDDRDPVIEGVGGKTAGRTPVGSAAPECALLSPTPTAACAGLGGMA